MLGLSPLGSDAIGGEEVLLNTVALTGVSATGYVGNVESLNTKLVGVAATSDVGSIAGQSVSVALTGVSATGYAQTLPVFVSITGVSATGAVGSVVQGVARKLRGIAAKASISSLLLPMHPTNEPSRVRWVGSRVSVDGDDMGFGLAGPMTIESSIEFGQQNVLGFRLADSAWPAAGNLWGNKPAEAFVSLGFNPQSMAETKIFTGYTLQKKAAGINPIVSDLVCADSSIAYTGIAVCYSLGAYSGKTRGEIITEVAETVGVTLTDVPAGGIVNKPITLNNADLLQFIADFGLVENWYPHIDRYGNLSVRVLNEPTTGWTLDAEKGDIDLDTFQETYPTRPPCRWYVTGTEAVNVLDEDGNPERITTIQIDEEYAIYNPKCRRSVDPTGHVLPAAELMLIARITTATTTIGGDEVLKETTTESFYNPEYFDPNHDSYPATNNYSEAYTDNSFHRDAVESVMETSKVIVETTRDGVGTVLSQHTVTYGWHSRQAAFHFVDRDRPEEILNSGLDNSFLYSDGKAYYTPGQYYDILSIIDTTYEYDSTTGTLLNQASTQQGWTAPETGCDTFTLSYLYGGLESVRVSNGTEFVGEPTFAPVVSSLGVTIAFIVSGFSGGIALDRQGFITGTVGSSGGGVDARVNCVWRRDWKWGGQDWRSQQTETFQMTKRVSTRFTVVDGQITNTRETTEQFAKIESGFNTTPYFDLYPLMFADGKWYEGPESFTTTGIKFTHYEQLGSTGHAKTTYSVDLLTGEVTIDAPVYSDGSMPLAPTLGSSLRWARFPIVVEISVPDCAFVDSKQNLDLPWAENEADLNRAGIRAAQRAMAIVREFDCAWNPLVEPGDGLMLTSREHGIINEWHIITDVKATIDIGADMHIIAERWPIVE